MKILILVVTLFIAGCGPTFSSTYEVNAPNGHRVVTEQTDGWSTTRKEVVDTDAKARECRQYLTTPAGSASAYQQCLANAMALQGGLLGMPYDNSGAALAVQINTGSFALAPFNGASPAYAVAMPQPAPPPETTAAPAKNKKGSSSDKTLVKIVRELDRQSADICALKKSQGQSCDEK